MADSFTSTTHNSWGGRIVSSITGILFGIVLILISIVLLGWNEANSLDTAKSLKEGASAVIDIGPGSVDAANNGRLIHVTGEVTTTETVKDSDFEVSAAALRLKRSVEMYQWTEKESQEEKKNLGGSTDTVTTYTYDKAWSGSTIDSSKFKKPEGHENPGSMIADDETFIAEDIMLGAFSVPDSIVDKMDGDVTLTPTDEEFAKLPGNAKEDAHQIKGGYYFGKNPSKPEVGDQRVSFEILKPGIFSIIAGQTGNTFQPYTTKIGKEIERVESGTMSAALMFKHAQDENRVIAWLLRLLGFVLMFIGFALIFKPLSVLADVLPFLGSLVGAGTGIIAFLLAVAGTLTTIAIAWLVVRPLLGGTMLVVAAASVVWMFRLNAKKKAPPKTS